MTKQPNKAPDISRNRTPKTDSPSISCLQQDTEIDGTKNAQSYTNAPTTSVRTEIRTYRTSWRTPPGFSKSHELKAAQGIQLMSERCAAQVRLLAGEAFRFFREGAVQIGGMRASVQLQRLLKCSENLAQSYMFTLANACEQSMRHAEKLEWLVRLLTTDYADAIPSIMFFAEAPRNLIVSMAKRFGVSEKWMGRTIRGFRNRIDPLLSYGLGRETDSFKMSDKHFKRQAERLLRQVETTEQSMSSAGKDISKVVTFRKKVELLYDRADELSDLFNHIIPGQRCLKALTEEAQRRLGTRSNLRSALRSILAAAIVETPMTLVNHLTVDNCIAIPFAVSTRKTLPLELLMGSRFNIRRGNASEMTEDFRTKGYTEVKVRIGKEWISMHVMAAKKMRQVIAGGAQVASVRVLPPRGPSRKVLFDIAFRGNEFRPRTKFLDGVSPREESEAAIGIDPNRPGVDVFVIGGRKLAPLGNMSQAVKISENLMTLRETEIPRVARARDRAEKRGDIRKAFKLRKELGLLHGRMVRLKGELDRVCGQELARVVVEYGPKVIGYESCVEGLSTRGTKGALAKAITHMPKRVGPILEYVVDVMHGRGLSVETIGVNPRVGRHTECGGRLKNTEKWDTLRCEGCGRIVNRHHNAAMTYAQRALSAYQGSIQSSMQGDDGSGQVYSMRRI